MSNATAEHAAGWYLHTFVSLNSEGMTRPRVKVCKTRKYASTGASEEAVIIRRYLNISKLRDSRRKQSRWRSYERSDIINESVESIVSKTSKTVFLQKNRLQTYIRRNRTSSVNVNLFFIFIQPLKYFYCPKIFKVMDIVIASPCLNRFSDMQLKREKETRRYRWILERMFKLWEDNDAWQDDKARDY